MKNIAIGQYYPSGSVLHRLDPRMKIVLTVLYIVCTFLCKNIWSFALLLASALVLILIGKIPLRTVLGGLKAIFLILVFTSFINIFLTKGETPIVEWKFIHIYVEGIYTAVFMVIRISTLIVGTGMFLTYTTKPIELTDALEDLLSPLKKIHVPVHEFAMMMTIALRFIPTLVEETDKIMTAQKARGTDFTEGGLIRRIRSLIPIIIPLFASAFNRAGDLAIAMEGRCYHGGEGRTRMHVRHLRAVDWIPLVLIVGFGVALLVLNRVGFGYTMP